MYGLFREGEFHRPGQQLRETRRTGNLMALLIRIAQGLDVLVRVDATPIVPVDDWQAGVSSRSFDIIIRNKQKVVLAPTLLNVFTRSVFHLYGPSSNV